MATGLVKWCRARFLAGYKPFSVASGGAEGSDSEQLLASVAASPCNSSPPAPPSLSDSLPSVIIAAGTPPAAPAPPASSAPTAAAAAATPASATWPSNHDNNTNTCNPATGQINFDGFECDVSVAEGDRRRQEFSFTLYDLDGHGKITKDDIAGLVTTIYDTLGASIQVPPCGSKTIKVKLTVSPDQRGGGLCRVAPNKSSPKNNNPALPPCRGGARGPPNPTTTCCYVKSCNACSHGRPHARRLPRRRRAPRQRCRAEHVVESDVEDDVSTKHCKQQEVEEEEDDDDDDEEELDRRVGGNDNVPSPYYNSSEGGDVSDNSDVISPSLSPLTPLVTEHTINGKIQRQQLLEIIQANMEKNHLSFHATRKRPQAELVIPLEGNEPASPYVQRAKNVSVATRSAAAATAGGGIYHKPVREQNQQTPTNTPKYPVKNRSSNLRKRSHQNSPNKLPRNNPAQQQQQHAQIPNNQQQQQQVIDQVPNYTNNCFNNKCNNETQNCSIGKASKKHLLKHATREQDQARAMAQVVRWLEREFFQNSSNNATPTSSRRHVHEHIHHHYHHYHSEALV